MTVLYLESLRKAGVYDTWAVSGPRDIPSAFGSECIWIIPGTITE
jgi:hypothetical protein